MSDQLNTETTSSIAAHKTKATNSINVPSYAKQVMHVDHTSLHVLEEATDSDFIVIDASRIEKLMPKFISLAGLCITGLRNCPSLRAVSSRSVEIADADDELEFASINAPKIRLTRCRNLEELLPAGDLVTYLVEEVLVTDCPKFNHSPTVNTLEEIDPRDMEAPDYYNSLLRSVHANNKRFLSKYPNKPTWEMLRIEDRPIEAIYSLLGNQILEYKQVWVLKSCRRHAQVPKAIVEREPHVIEFGPMITDVFSYDYRGGLSEYFFVEALVFVRYLRTHCEQWFPSDVDDPVSVTIAELIESIFCNRSAFQALHFSLQHDQGWHWADALKVCYQISRETVFYTDILTHSKSTVDNEVQRVLRKLSTFFIQDGNELISKDDLISAFINYNAAHYFYANPDNACSVSEQDLDNPGIEALREEAEKDLLGFLQSYPLNSKDLYDIVDISSAYSVIEDISSVISKH